MTLELYFRISSYLLILTSFLMLVATRQLDPVSYILFGTVLGVSWMIDSGRISWSLSPGSVNWIMLAFLPFPFIDWLVLGTTPIVALIHFVFFASALKLLQHKRNRDWIWLYIVAFFQLLLAAGMMIDTLFFLLLLIFLFSAISTLVAFEIRRAASLKTDDTLEQQEYWRESETEIRRLKEPGWPGISVFSALSLGSIAILATPLFLAMPRLALRNSGAGWMQGTSLSGFSETVRLGDVGQLKLNPKLVMRVRVVQPPDQYRSSLKWRGVTLDNYDGTSWHDSATLKRGTKADARPVTKFGNTYWVDETAANNHSGANPFLTHQIFYLEPLGTPTIFAAPNAIWVEGLPSLWKDSSDGLWTSNHSMNRIAYQVESDSRQASDKELREVNPSSFEDEIRLRYTQIPPMLDPRIGQLAAEVSGRTSYQIDKAREIERYLRVTYKYSLDLRRTREKDPVADFLFNVKAGHCEYFATAMAMMLRTQGIPARLVNGFQMGEYSDVSDFYTVRQSDAHSWVEAYFGQYGWVSFDPTPPAGLSQYETGWLAVLRHYTDAGEMFWLEHVIGFGSGEQAALAFRAQRAFSDYQSDSAAGWEKFKTRLGNVISGLRGNFGTQEGLKGVSSRLLNPVTLTGLALIAALGGLVYWKRKPKSWKQLAKDDEALSAVLFYQEMLDLLAKRGIRRNPEQTPREFAESLSIPAVIALTNIYERLRFGGGKLNSPEITSIESQLRELKNLPQ